jgi:hypothetical protein
MAITNMSEHLSTNKIQQVGDEFYVCNTGAQKM